MSKGRGEGWGEEGGGGLSKGVCDLSSVIA